MSWELHPPIDVDKGTAVRAMADGLGAIAYAGDDVGDFPGFDALDALDAQGTSVLRVAVDSDEAPPGLLERADLVVDGPGGIRNLLARLDQAL